MDNPGPEFVRSRAAHAWTSAAAWTSSSAIRTRCCRPIFRTHPDRVLRPDYRGRRSQRSGRTRGPGDRPAAAEDRRRPRVRRRLAPVASRAARACGSDIVDAHPNFSTFTFTRNGIRRRLGDPPCMTRTRQAVVTGASGFIGHGARAASSRRRLDRRGRRSASRFADPDQPATAGRCRASRRARWPARRPHRRFSTWRHRRTSPRRSRTRATISTTRFAASSRCSKPRATRAAGSCFPSTASIFDSSNPLPLPERAFPRPTSPYAAGKLGGEAYCHAYHRSLRPRRPHRAAVQRLRRRHVSLRDSRHHPQDSAEPRRADDSRRRHPGARLPLHRRCGARA